MHYNYRRGMQSNEFRFQSVHGRTLACHAKRRGSLPLGTARIFFRRLKMKICPKCKNEHEKNGSFCSRSCANSRTWSQKDKDKKSESAKKYYSKNENANKGKPGWKHSEEMKELKRQKAINAWNKIGRKPEEHFIIKNRIQVSKYRATKQKAICEDSDLELIKQIYKMCPKGYEVDHIIPLIEGGLHHQNNLQYLPAIENRKKNRTQNYDRSLVIRWQDKVNIPQ